MEIKNNSYIKGRNGNFLTSFLLPLIFAIFGAFIAIILLFNVKIKGKLLYTYLNISLPQQTEETNKNSKNDEPNNTLDNFNKTSIEVAKKVRPSIVNIDIEFNVKTVFDTNAKSKANGSGIILTKDGYILTNNHVVNPTSSSSFYNVSDAKKITVTLIDDEKVDAKIIGTDPKTDLAIIKIEKNDLKPATIGDSDKVQIGEFVMAIGSPLGFQSSVTNGIVSSINRKLDLNDGHSFNSIQTNATINAGNSGGALVNLRGEVIGVNTLKLSGQGIEGIGFAIPINDTKEVTKQLIENKKVDRPSLGFSGVVVSKEEADKFKVKPGILVKEIVPNSTAEKAGLKPKDIVIKFNGKEISNFNDIEQLKIYLKEGDEVSFTIIREKGKEETLKTKLVKIEEEKKEESKKQNTPDINQDIFDYFFNR